MPISVNQIAQSQHGWEPQRSNNFIVTFNVPGLDLDKADFYVALKSFPYPKEANVRKTIRWFNESRHYAGSVADFESKDLQIRDYLDQTAAQRLMEWRRLVWEPSTANVGFARNYKGSGVLYLLPPGNGNMDLDITKNLWASGARVIYLQGCFPLSFDMGTFDMEQEGDQVMVNCDISVDRAYPGDADGTAMLSAMNPINLT